LVENGTTYTLASGVVDMQLQYGVSTSANDPTVADDTGWVDATGDWGGAPLDAAHAQLVKAVRVAVVARSQEYEKPDSGSCSTTTTTMASGWSTWATFDPTKYSTDWACYRYKVVETEIPLRNMIWAKF
jgi:type IV pilus assembly protein PilW